MSSIWGTYPWFEEDGDELIHPDDRGNIKILIGNSKAYEFVKKDDGYNELKYGENVFRIKDVLKKELPEPNYKIGETVMIKNKDCIGAVITDVMWHTSMQKYYYYLSVNGKKKTRRYFDDDLTKKE